MNQHLTLCGAVALCRLKMSQHNSLVRMTSQCSTACCGHLQCVLLVGADVLLPEEVLPEGKLSTCRCRLPRCCGALQSRCGVLTDAGAQVDLQQRHDLESMKVEVSNIIHSSNERAAITNTNTQRRRCRLSSDRLPSR